MILDAVTALIRIHWLVPGKYMLNFFVMVVLASIEVMEIIGCVSGLISGPVVRD